MTQRFCCPGYFPSTVKITVWMPLPCRVLVKSNNDTKIFNECGIESSTRLIYTNDCDKIYSGTYRQIYYHQGSLYSGQNSNYSFGTNKGKIIGIENNIYRNDGFVGSYLKLLQCDGTVINEFKGHLQIGSSGDYQREFTCVLTLLSINNPDETSACELTLKKEDNVIFQQIYDECPQVYQEECKRNGNQQTFYVDLDTKVRIGFRVVVPGIKKECLLIDNNNNNLSFSKVLVRIYEGLLPFNLSVTPIASFTSPEGCEAPTYTIECDPLDKEDDCKSCPDGSCELICGESVCCYDNNGLLIESFPLSEKC